MVGFREGFCSRSLPLACRWLCFPRILTWSSFCGCLCLNVSSYKDTSHSELGTTHMTSCYFECECESHSVMSDSLQTHGLYIAHQAPLSMQFSRQEYRSGLPFPSPGYLPDSGIEPGSPTLQADSLCLTQQSWRVWQFYWVTESSQFWGCKIISRKRK